MKLNKSLKNYIIGYAIGISAYLLQEKIINQAPDKSFAFIGVHKDQGLNTHIFDGDAKQKKDGFFELDRVNLPQVIYVGSLELEKFDSDSSKYLNIKANSKTIIVIDADIAKNFSFKTEEHTSFSAINDKIIGKEKFFYLKPNNYNFSINIDGTTTPNLYYFEIKDGKLLAPQKIEYKLNEENKTVTSSELERYKKIEYYGDIKIPDIGDTKSSIIGPLTIKDYAKFAEQLKKQNIPSTEIKLKQLEVSSKDNYLKKY